VKAFEKKQNDLYDANVKKANEENDAIEARAQQVITGKKPLTPDQRAIKRCITSGRLPASCTGNALLGAFSQMVSQVLPEADEEARAGPVMAGVFQGAGNWRRDFIDGGVLVNCSILSPDQRNYELEFKNNRTALVIDTTPTPLVLTLRADGTIVGPGPLQIDGVIATGYDGGGSNASGYKDQNGASLTQSQVAAVPRRTIRAATACMEGVAAEATPHSRTKQLPPALNLSTKGAVLAYRRCKRIC
jgi:hypothetical protein